MKYLTLENNHLYGIRRFLCFVSLLGSDSLPKYIQPPVTPGHEFVGEVVKLGPGKILNNNSDLLLLLLLYIIIR